MIELKDIQGNVILSTEINKGAKRKFELMNEDYITLPFSLDAPVEIGLGTYADIDAGLFEVTDLQKPTYNTTTGGYDYQLRLDAYYWKWKNKIFKFTPETGGQEASWSLTASLDIQLGVFLRNLQALGYTYRGSEFEFSIDATVENKAISMTYDNTNMIDALSAMAESWDCEWWVTDNIIHFGRCEYGTAVDFEIGVNVAEMTSSASQSSYATRLYVFGSTKNLPSNYRPVDESVVVNGVVQRRLMLPEGTPYLDAYEGMSEEEAIEEVVVIEDVYPRTDGSISSVETYDASVENEDGTTTTETFYRFTDDGITFSSDYILEGEELGIKFTSGSLNGMEFGLVFNPNGESEKLEDGSWNPEAQLYEVVANEDYGRKLPDSTLHPKEGDTYILTGWDSSKIADLGLVSKAEEELLEEGKKILAKRKIDPNTYNCKMFSDYMYGLDDEGNQDSYFARTFSVGNRVNLINDAYFKDGRQSRIIGYEYNLDFPFDSPTYVVGESAAYSRLGELEDKVESLVLGGITYNYSGGSGVYVIGTNDTTAPTDRNVYSALRSDKSYLRKDKSDRTSYSLGVGGSLSVENGATIKGQTETDDVIVNESIHSKEFISGFTAGKGWAIRLKDYLNSAGVSEQRSVAEFDDLIVRGTMRVFEFIVSQMLGENDNRTFTGMMEVDHYDPETGKVWLDTQDGKLYNTFRKDDIILVQQYNGMPSEDNGYYITKQYELIIDEVGVGDLSLGEDRLDWVTFRNFASPMDGYAKDIITKGDTFVRVDNLTDPNRKGIIQVMTVGEDTPYMDVIYGKKTDPDNALKSRFGNLQGVYNHLFGWLKDFGAYIANLYAVGEFRIAHTGEDVADKIEMVKGAFRTNFSKTYFEMKDEANYLFNGSFSGDLEGWVLGESGTEFMVVDGVAIYANRNLMTANTKFAGRAVYNDKNMLRVFNSDVTQNNETIKKFGSHKEYLPMDGSETEPSYEFVEKPDKAYLIMRLYCEADGTVEIGFDNGDTDTDALPFITMDVVKRAEEYLVEAEGIWNNEGDFVIRSTGDIYVEFVTLSDKPLENMQTTTETWMEQDAGRIALLGQKIDETNNSVTDLGIELDATNEQVNLYVNKTVNLESSTKSLESRITLSEARIDAVAGSIETDAYGNIINISKSGLVLDSEFASLFSNEVNSQGVAKSAELDLYVLSDDLEYLVSKIEISADQINLSGAVTYSDLSDSLQDELDGKVTSDELKALRTELNSSISTLNSTVDTLQTEVDEKATTKALTDYVTQLTTSISGKADKDLSNAVVSGYTFIYNGLIRTNFIDVDNIVTKQLEATNGTYTLSLDKNGFEINYNKNSQSLVFLYGDATYGSTFQMWNIGNSRWVYLNPNNFTMGSTSSYNLAVEMSTGLMNLNNGLVIKNLGIYTDGTGSFSGGFYVTSVSTFSISSYTASSYQGRVIFVYFSNECIVSGLAAGSVKCKYGTWFISNGSSWYHIGSKY